jgi:hypothetical protein
MAVDWDRYNRLRESASFNCEFFRGHYQDCSKNARAMTAVGSPSWTMVNGLPALVSPAGIVSGNVAALVDVTTSFAIEILYRRGPESGANGMIVSQQMAGNTYGFSMFYQGGNGRFLSQVANAGGGDGLVYYGGTLERGATNHSIHCIRSAGTAGSIWYGGVPVTTTVAAAVAPLNITAPSPVRLLNAGYGAQNAACLLVRVYPFALTNSDCAALYGAARSLVGEI